MTGQCSSIVDDLLGLWPTVCHGFSNEYFSVSPAVNKDGTEWLIFSYDYSDEVGSSTYASLAVPAAKLQQEVARILRTQPTGEITAPIAVIPVAPLRPGYIGDPRVPTMGIEWSLSVVLDLDGHVIVCVADGTRFARGAPSYPLPLETRFRRAFNKKDALPLDISAQSLTAAHLPVDPWRAYLPAGN